MEFACIVDRGRKQFADYGVIPDALTNDRFLGLERRSTDLLFRLDKDARLNKGLELFSDPLRSEKALESMRCVQRPSPPGPVIRQGTWYKFATGTPTHRG
jgi:hypothetical protein